MTDNTPGQVPEALDDLYLKLHGLSKHLESSGRIDESDAPEAYPAILDAMNLVRRLQSEAAQVPATTAQPVQDYAELLESDEHIGTEERNEIAAELRRLHAQVAALTAQLAAPQGVAYADAHGAIMGAAYDFRDAHISGSPNQKRSAHAALESAVTHALRASNGQSPATRITVEQVEDAIGLQSTAWDTIGAEKIVEAVLRLANGQAPAGATNTKTHALLSTMIGLFLRAKEKIGYQPGSAIDKTVAEAVEHLKDWPYPETPTAQAAPATQQAGEVRTCKQDLQVAVWVMPDGKGGGQFSWEAQDERFWVRLSAPQPSPTAQAAPAAKAEVRRSDLVPGVMHCAKCKFQLNRVTLCVSDGNAYAGDNKTEPCPNGCGPLWPVTWEQEARNCWKTLEEMHERLQAAPATTDFTTLDAAMRAIQQAIGLIGEPADERMQTIKRVLRGAVIVAEDSGEMAAPAAGAVAGPTRAQIRDVFLANGFTVKEGQTDLKPYVYAAAEALLALAAAPTPAAQADSVPAPVRDVEREAFKAAHRHLELDEVPDAWARPMFKHSHVEASWLGWIARAARVSENGQPATQGNELLTVAERNIRSFLRSATFKSESDREAALSCVDVLWAAARAPADSVLEDAARYRWLRRPHLAAGHGSISVVLDDRANGNMSRTIWLDRLDAVIDAARKQGGAT